jgi:hypothetical protein
MLAVNTAPPACNDDLNSIGRGTEAACAELYVVGC